MKTDLKNTTFIVPLRIDTGDRLRNVILSTSYLLHNFDTTVMIKEVDSERRFETFALPIIERLVDTSNLVHIFEKEKEVGFHQSGRNSGVLHCGLAYKPGSLKAKLAVSGIKQMIKYCKDYKINHDVCGKIVVASDEHEEKLLDNTAESCLLYTSPSPRDRTRSRMPSSA